MNQLRDGRRRCPYHDQHFATVYHQTSLKGWLGIREDGYIHGSVSDGMIYASPTPEKTFSCARHKGIILEISVRRSYLDFTCTEPGKVRFSPKKDYNINKSVMVGDTPDSVPHSRQWTNEHIQVRHLVGCTCGCTPSSGGNGV
ncbi:unnamed protein product [Vitrella brassicaformis CCMP3155]|uniref:Uncharacterized protein n=2 Tax=Vitrella brassicaformis TaxID=1169539 RepID=A0A0G4EKJ5_VITBC|nr:unnamed protein product [Vitrella brassicaformis CCMP3155]|eukprot:CEL97965.1 unnamed protein product [Vitrella brassicaformis CCMP3155]